MKPISCIDYSADLPLCCGLRQNVKNRRHSAGGSPAYNFRNSAARQAIPERP
jgi:hypothetical protein